MALALFSSDVSGHVASHVSSSGAANGAVHGSTGTGAASAAAAGSATAVSPWHTSGVGTASYARYVVYIHILVHVCMLNTAAMLLVSKLACSESECIHNSCDITTTGCISERHVTAAATENLSKIL